MFKKMKWVLYQPDDNYDLRLAVEGGGSGCGGIEDPVSFKNVAEGQQTRRGQRTRHFKHSAMEQEGLAINASVASKASITV